MVQAALKGPSDSKMAPPSLDVWRSATTMSGAPFVMTFGTLLMLWLPVDNWDCQVKVGHDN